METINNTKKRTSQLLCIDALADDAAAARRIVLNGRDVEYNECPLLVLAECRIHTKKKKGDRRPAAADAVGWHVFWRPGPGS